MSVRQLRATCISKSGPCFVPDELSHECAWKRSARTVLNARIWNAWKLSGMRDARLGGNNTTSGSKRACSLQGSYCVHKKASRRQANSKRTACQVGQVAEFVSASRDSGWAKHQQNLSRDEGQKRPLGQFPWQIQQSRCVLLGVTVPFFFLLHGKMFARITEEPVIVTRLRCRASRLRG
ncbi:hypothetical protein VTK26DRAFT_8987 [Humicola hyalothermophila]